MYLRSIIGNPVGWLVNRNGSEFSAVTVYEPLSSLNLVADLTIPALPLQAPASLPVVFKRLFWRPTKILFSAGYNQNSSCFSDESWFFINGICTNEKVARINARYLSKLFHRPFQIVQNATDGAFVDLVECVIGKGVDSGQLTEPAQKGYPAILAALKDPRNERVVVICHSQGTIIMSNILQALKDPDYKHALYLEGNGASTRSCTDEPEALDNVSLLKKLEIYAFANCATTMTHVEGQGYPYIESFANQYDIVARFGCTSPKAVQLGIQIDGPTFERKGKWGHLLNSHYLFGIEEHLLSAQPNPYRTTCATKEPRLYQYVQGAKAPPVGRHLRLVGAD